ASRMSRMAGHFLALLEGAVAEPGRRISQLPLLTGRERHQALLEWNDTGVECRQEPLVHELVALQAGRRPDALAVGSRDGGLSFGELDRRSTLLARLLRRLGVGPEVLVAVCTDRTLDRVVGIVGVLKAGGAYVSLDPSYPRERLSFLLEDAG